MASSRAFCSVEAWRVRRGRKSEARPTAREDRAAEAVHEGMTDVAIGGRFLEESLQDIGDDNKEVRGNRVALTKASAALEPAPRHATPVRRMDVLPVRSVLAIQEHHRSPKPRERRMKSRLSQEIESKAFFEVKLQDNSGCMALVTAAEKVSDV